MTTGKELYGPVGAKEPILFHGKWGWVRVHCQECNKDYDIREIENETTHPHALHVARFDCPQGHRSEARRMFTEKVPESMPQNRMWDLMEKSQIEGLNEQERQELQKLFLNMAAFDLAVLDDEGLLESDETDSRRPKS